MLLRSISVTNPEHIDISALKTALKRLTLSVSESRSVINNLKKVSLPPGWHHKLDQIEGIIA